MYLLSLNKTLLQKYFHFTLSYAIWASCCAVALVLQTGQLLRVEINFYLGGLVFFATFCSYNFHFLIGSLQLHKKLSVAFFLGQKVRCCCCIIGAMGVMLFFVPSQVNSIILLIAALLTATYSLPLFPIKGFGFIRKPGILKTFLLAFTWMFVTGYFPIHQAGLKITTCFTMLLLLHRFLFMFILCLMFDSRDAALDKTSGLHSIVTDINPKFLKWLIYAVFILLLLLVLLLAKNGLQPPETIALVLVVSITFIMYRLSLKRRGFVFYYFGVDGLMVLSGLFTAIAHLF